MSMISFSLILVGGVCRMGVLFSFCASYSEFENSEEGESVSSKHFER
jgi:hypothetical protein